MKKVPFWFCVVFALATYSGSCTDSATDPEEKKCGDSKSWTANGTFTSRLEGATRTFVYEDLSTPQNICPEEHINAIYSVFVTPSKTKPNDMSFTGKAYWSLYRKTTELGKSSGGDYFATESVGLKEAFPNKGDKGYVYLQVLISFPSRGGANIDSVYFREYVQSAEIQLSYKQAK